MRRRSLVLSSVIAGLIVVAAGAAVFAVASTPGDSAGQRQPIAPIVAPSSTTTPSPAPTITDGPVIVTPEAPHDLGDDHGGDRKDNSGSGSGSSGKGSDDD